MTSAGPEEYGFLASRTAGGMWPPTCAPCGFSWGNGFAVFGIFCWVTHGVLPRASLSDRLPGTIDGAILSGTGQESAFLVWFGKRISGIERLRLGPKGTADC
jgi:hypothetical protein